jgi:hypothetical protein
VRQQIGRRKRCGGAGVQGARPDGGSGGRGGRTAHCDKEHVVEPGAEGIAALCHGVGHGRGASGRRNGKQQLATPIHETVDSPNSAAIPVDRHSFQ